MGSGILITGPLRPRAGQARPHGGTSIARNCREWYKTSPVRPAPVEGRPCARERKSSPPHHVFHAGNTTGDDSGKG